jgi:hypothetical protein
MASYRVLPFPTTMAELVKVVRASLAANATVEIIADDKGVFQLVEWFGRRTVWSRHKEIE